MIKLGWYKFKEAIGIGDSNENRAAIAAIHADVEKRQQAIMDGAKKVSDYANKAKHSFDNAYLKTDGTGVNEFFGGSKIGTNEQLQKLAGGIGTGTEKGTGTGTEKGKANEAIVTGGKRNTTIHIKMGDMVGSMNFNGGLSENKNEIKQTLQMLLSEVLGMAETQVS
jgi:hypothetical protein